MIGQSPVSYIAIGTIRRVVNVVTSSLVPSDCHKVVIPFECRTVVFPFECRTVVFPFECRTGRLVC